jgi:hypothetical protein
MALTAAGFMLLLGLMLGPSRTTAQDTTEAPHPAHIHSGSCTELGDVVYPLTDVSSATMGTPVAAPTSGEMGTPTMTADMAMATPTMGEMEMGSPTATNAETSVTTVEASLTDLTAGGYAINVHESAENIGNYIACGNIGDMSGSADVTVTLDPLNDSGFSGTATLHDNGDDTTTVTIELKHAEM